MIEVLTEALTGGSGWVLGIGIALLVVMAVLMTRPSSSIGSTTTDELDAEDGRETPWPER
ncbi:hypothetical protein ACIO3O_34535 [Streptomyces sp. NPDC087440]|uniref:hypothetical protein n=1 Tax=Streptomyces sp. NPDC087440 TaxID=3365790 RepID=UPI00382EEC3A